MAATAVIVPFEAAEPAVFRWRRAYTRDGAAGMPAHVTLISPFIDDALLVAGQIHELREVLAGFAPFDVRFAAFGRFEGPPPVLYLAPDPVAPFLEIMEAIAARFPGHPPFGGAFDEIVPHLTVVQTDAAERHAEAEADVARRLPIGVRAAQVHVMQLAAGSAWQVRSRIALG